MFNTVLDWGNMSQATVYLHQHKDVLPECTEPYGQFNLQIKGPTKPGTYQDRFFVITDYKMNGLPRKQLPCKAVEENEKLGYDGGVGKCIHGKFTILKYHSFEKAFMVLSFHDRIYGEQDELQTTLDNR